MKKRCKLKRKTMKVAKSRTRKFKDVKEMESSKNDQKRKNAILKTFGDEKVMENEKLQKII